MRYPRAIISILVLIVTFGVCLVNLAHIGGPFRVIAGVLFVLVGPGGALTGLLALRDVVTTVVVTVAVGLGLATVTSTALLYAELWSSDTVLAILVVISVLGAGLQLGLSFAERSRFARQDGAPG